MIPRLSTIIVIISLFFSSLCLTVNVVAEEKVTELHNKTPIVQAPVNVWNMNWVHDAAGTIFQNSERGPISESLYKSCSSHVPKAIEPGFPVQCIHNGGSYHGGPAIHTLIGNMDGDDELEIVVSALAEGPLYAWNHDGTSVTGWPVSGISGAGYPGMGLLVGGSRLGVCSGHWGIPGQLVAYDGSGATLSGWPIASANYVTTPPALADIDGDGLMEIFIGEEDWQIHAYHSDGSTVSGWPVNPGLGTQEIHTPAIADLDGDGDLEIIAGSGSSTAGVYLFAYHHDGTAVNGFPVQFPKGHPDTFAAVGDVDGDLEPEIVIVLKESSYPWGSIVTIISNQGVVENSWFCSDTVSYGTAPSLADFNSDMIPEIVVQTDNALDVWFGDGTVLSGWPVTWTGRWLGNSAPVVGDIDGDLVPDIVITTQIAGSSENGEVRIFDAAGNPLPGYPMSLAIGSGAVPAIADIDLDNRNEIIITGSYWNGYSGFYDKVWVFDEGGLNHGPVQWGQFGGNPEHTGSFLSGVTLNLTGDLLFWSSANAASGYDVVRGDVSLLQSSGGDFSGAATQECLANNVASVSFTYSDIPYPGEAYWFLVRPIGPSGVGTYDSSGPGQIEPRDSEINAASNSCP